MAALEPQYMTILKKVLAERFVPLLPPLLGAAKPEDQAAKQLSRAFSAFALHKLLNITPKAEHPHEPPGPPKNYGADITTLIELLESGRL